MTNSTGVIGRRTVLGGLGGIFAAPAIVSAERAYPSKTVRYINPFPAGGATDTLSRLFCAKMSELSGQQWIVENKGGSGGNVGVDALAQSAPDGYTLGLGGIASHAIAPTLYAKLPFNPRSDFTFVSTIWQLPNMLVVNPDVPARTVPELIELLKKNPANIPTARRARARRCICRASCSRSRPRSTCCTSPIAVRRRRCRTCWRARSA